MPSCQIIAPLKLKWTSLWRDRLLSGNTNLFGAFLTYRLKRYLSLEKVSLRGPWKRRFGRWIPAGSEPRVSGRSGTLRSDIGRYFPPRSSWERLKIWPHLPDRRNLSELRGSVTAFSVYSDFCGNVVIVNPGRNFLCLAVWAFVLVSGLACTAQIVAPARVTQADVIREIDAVERNREASLVGYSVTEHYTIQNSHFQMAAEVVVQTVYKRAGGKTY